MSFPYFNKWTISMYKFSGKEGCLVPKCKLCQPRPAASALAGLGFDTCWISRLHFEMVITLVLISGIWRSAHFPVKWTPLFPENNFFSVGYCLLFVSTCNQVASTYCTKFNPFLHTSAFKLLSLGDWAVVHIEQNFKALHFSQILNSFLFGLDFSLGDIKD